MEHHVVHEAVYPTMYEPKAPTDLVRVGGPSDGGYVLAERAIMASRGLLSFGIGDDCSFEDDFARRAGCPVVAFDHTVNSRVWLSRTLLNLRKGFFYADLARLRYLKRWMTYLRLFKMGPHRHIRRAIGSGARASVTYPQTLEMARLETPVFLKIDIEGAEYRILDDIVAGAEALTGLVIELHDIDLHRERIARFLAAMAPRMALIHFHPNLTAPLARDETATAVELAFVSVSLLKEGEMLEPRSLPIPGIDAPNRPGLTEPRLRFAEPGEATGRARQFEGAHAHR